MSLHCFVTKESVRFLKSMVFWCIHGDIYRVDFRFKSVLLEISC